jgi:hypothetical protein
MKKRKGNKKYNNTNEIVEIIPTKKSYQDITVK